MFVAWKQGRKCIFFTVHKFLLIINWKIIFFYHWKFYQMFYLLEVLNFFFFLIWQGLMMFDHSFWIFSVWLMKHHCLCWINCWLAQIFIFFILCYLLNKHSFLSFAFFFFKIWIVVWRCRWQHRLSSSALLQPPYSTDKS